MEITLRRPGTTCCLIWGGGIEPQAQLQIPQNLFGIVFGNWVS